MLNNLIHGAEKHRAYFYRIGTTVAALAVVYGFVDGKETSGLLALLAAVLGGTASANTSTKSGD